ncbi:MAG: hypothetical protein JXA82_17620 [Sedimentisphaerales bacterium]|nr:hypothetical protein [Sedimentisphaerales bacterium]
MAIVPPIRPATMVFAKIFVPAMEIVGIVKVASIVSVSTCVFPGKCAKMTNAWTNALPMTIVTDVMSARMEHARNRTLLVLGNVVNGVNHSADVWIERVTVVMANTTHVWTANVSVLVKMSTHKIPRLYGQQ